MIVGAVRSSVISPEAATAPAPIGRTYVRHKSRSIHAGDRAGSRIQRPRQMGSEEVDRRHQHQPGKHAPCKHDRRHTDANDVPHSLGTPACNPPGWLPPAADAASRRNPARSLARTATAQNKIVVLKQRINSTQDPEPTKHPRRERTAALACHQNIRTRCPLRIHQNVPCSSTINCRRSGIMNSTPSHPPNNASAKILVDSRSNPRKMRAREA